MEGEMDTNIGHQYVVAHTEIPIPSVKDSFFSFYHVGLIWLDGMVTVCDVFHGWHVHSMVGNQQFHSSLHKLPSYVTILQVRQQEQAQVLLI